METDATAAAGRTVAMRDAGRMPGTAAPTRRRGPRGFAGVALGILAGVGGFVDMGGVVTSSQAGAGFRYALLWTVIPGVAGFAIYAEMSGRVVIASGRATFDLIRDRLGSRLSLIPLAALSVVNLLTLVVEICGMALAVQLLTHVSYLVWVPPAAIALLVVLWRARFEVLDNTAALCGLIILVTVVAAVKLHPAWPHLGWSLLHPATTEAHPAGAYLFLVVSLLGARPTPPGPAMTTLLDIITALTIAILATFGWALVSLRRLTVGRRPRITIYSRTGHPIAAEELNPPDQPRRSD